MSFEIPRAILAAAALAMIASPAAAWGPGPPGAWLLAAACHEDDVRLCPGVSVGGGRVMRCLAQQQPRLGEPCYSSLRAAAAIVACTPDFHRFCPGVPAGQGTFRVQISTRICRLTPGHSTAMRRIFSTLRSSDDGRPPAGA